MSGPGASVYFPHAISEAGMADLNRILDSLGTRRASSEHDQILRVWSTKAIGGTYETEPIKWWPFYFSVRPAGGVENEDVKKFRNWIRVEFGFRPEQSIGINANCSGVVNHRILGEICLWLLERFGGIVNFQGALLPRMPLREWTENNWDEVRSRADALLSPLAGKVVERLYRTAGDRTWASHLADATFLRAWLAHPKFHMIK